MSKEDHYRAIVECIDRAAKVSAYEEDQGALHEVRKELTKAIDEALASARAQYVSNCPPKTRVWDELYRAVNKHHDHAVENARRRPLDDHAQMYHAGAEGLRHALREWCDCPDARQVRYLLCAMASIAFTEYQRIGKDKGSRRWYDLTREMARCLRRILELIGEQADHYGHQQAVMTAILDTIATTEEINAE